MLIGEHLTFRLMSWHLMAYICNFRQFYQLLTLLFNCFNLNLAELKLSRLFIRNPGINFWSNLFFLNLSNITKWLTLKRITGLHFDCLYNCSIRQFNRNHLNSLTWHHNWHISDTDNYHLLKISFHNINQVTCKFVLNQTLEQ